VIWIQARYVIGAKLIQVFKSAALSDEFEAHYFKSILFVELQKTFSIEKFDYVETSCSAHERWRLRERYTIGTLWQCFQRKTTLRDFLTSNHGVILILKCNGS